VLDNLTASRFSALLDRDPKVAAYKLGLYTQRRPSLGPAEHPMQASVIGPGTLVVSPRPDRLRRAIEDLET